MRHDGSPRRLYLAFAVVLLLVGGVTMLGQPKQVSFISGKCKSADYRRLRFSVEQRLKLSREHGTIGGWAPPQAIYLAHRLSEYQRQNGICGSVVEVGVHEGSFAVPLAHTLKGDEKMLAIDVFEDQHKNIDGSGHGNRQKFEDNLRRFGVDIGKDIRIVKSSSTDLTSKDVLANVGPVRLFSVDGGHTAFTTAWDMGIATGACVEGCVVPVDDVLSIGWPGVWDGIYRYLLLDSDQPRGLVPFALYGNKLWFTTPSFHHIYTDLMKADPYFSVVTTFYPNRTVVNSVDIRIDELSNFLVKPNVSALEAFQMYLKTVV